ncbi:MAG: signal peptide peptidase SppA [Agarilytica sp.]
MFQFVGSLFKKFWHAISVVRGGIGNFVFLLLIIVILVGIFSGGPEPMPESAPLYVRITGQLVDQISYEPTIFDLMDENAQERETQVRDVTQAITRAGHDARITALVLNLNGLQGGSISKLEEVGQAIEIFQKSGKSVVAYADSFSQKQYFLASYADEIFINPLGHISLTGFGYFSSYFKDATEKLSLKFHLFKVGEYKDAAEPFVRNDMSDASREHNKAWINELWQRYTSIIENKRGLPPGAISDHIENFSQTISSNKAEFSELALEAQLADGIYSRIQLGNILRDRFGEDEDGYFNAIDYQRYLQSTQNHFPTQQDNIGLLYASGNIVDGWGESGQIGGDSFSELVQQAVDDSSIRALVIRIDSGGGSAFASEVIRAQIEEARNSGLPVYVSMGSAAASGGYWIATAAAEIWANPSTITGSIGVWGLVPNISESMKRLGVHSDGFGTTPLADIYQLDRPMSDQAKQVFQGGVDRIYARFISLVANARGMPNETVAPIAEGRVWTGQQALNLNLVDKLGSLDDLLNQVSEQHTPGTRQIKVIEKELSPTEAFMRALMEQTHWLGKELRVQLFEDALNVFGNNTHSLTTKASPFLDLPPFMNEDLTVQAKCWICIAP